VSKENPWGDVWPADWKEDVDVRLNRIEYELTEVRFRIKALECKQDPKKYNDHGACYTSPDST